MGEREAHAGAGEGADPVILADQGEKLPEFRETMELHTNSSNNTIFADAEGNIAYFHANFVPRRDTSSTGPGRWMEPIPPPSGRGFTRSTRPRWC